MNPVTSQQLLRAADACERAATAESRQEQWRADMEVAAQMEAIQIGLMQAEMAALSQTPHRTECLPLRAEGEDFGRVRSRIPQKLFFHLMKQKNFGFEGLASDEGQRDLLKAFPFCAVTTVSGKTTVPVAWRGGRARACRVNFQPNTLNLKA